MSLKERKAISETLRLENKKMEKRLQQLKNTINKEKEERLSSKNGPIWSNGGLDSGLLNYKRNLSGNINNKKLKVQLLKEEKIPEPKLKTNLKMIKKFSDNLEGLNSGYDSVTSIDLDSVRKTNGHLKCGQCESVKATVNCMECSEYYCSKCFAAFHLKGALRKHRSAPISATSGRRVPLSSSLFQPPVLSKIGQGQKHKDTNDFQNNGITNIHEVRPFISEQSARSHNMSVKAAATTTTTEDRNNSNNHINTDFDEEFSHQYFREALEAWREGTDPPTKATKKPILRTEEQATETMDRNTEGNGSKHQPEIQFTTGSNMSYADKLLLKKYKQQPVQQAIFGAEEMKRVLDLLSRNTENELQENKKMWATQMELEAAELDQESYTLFPTAQNGTNNFDAHNDDAENHLNLESICDLWNQIDHLNQPTNQTPNKVSSQPVVQFPNDNSNDKKINGIKESNSMSKASKFAPKHHKEPSKNSTVPVIEEIRQQTKEEDDSEATNIKNKQERPLSTRKQQRIKSARQNKTYVNTKPHSARRMSARTEKGGRITTKPSEFLNILSSLSQHLPHNNSMDNQHKGSPKRNLSRPPSSAIGAAKTKLSYSFYQHTPKSWKPNSAYYHDDGYDERNISIKPSDVPDNDSWLIEDTVQSDSLDTQLINDEICKLDALNNITRSEAESRNSINMKLNQRISVDKPNEESYFDAEPDPSHRSMSSHTTANINVYNNDHFAFNDEDDDEDELSDQFQKLQEEFTRISFNKDVSLEQDGGNDESDEDLIADSLDVSDNHFSSSRLDKQNVDKFYGEDSVDLRIQNSSSTTDENRQLQESVDRLFDEYDNSLSDDEGLTSSRFDDYEDVHGLR